MTTLLEQAIERLRALPDEDQDRIATLVLDLIEREDAEYQLTDEQVAEVERRLAEENPEVLTLDEVRDRFRRLGIL